MVVSPNPIDWALVCGGFHVQGVPIKLTQAAKLLLQTVESGQMPLLYVKLLDPVKLRRT